MTDAELEQRTRAKNYSFKIERVKLDDEWCWRGSAVVDGKQVEVAMVDGPSPDPSRTIRRFVLEQCARDLGVHWS